jgi:hypothetical protein
VVKMLENTNAFGISGLLMMLAGLVCTDTEIAKFSLSQEVYSYRSCGHLFLIS